MGEDDGWIKLHRSIRRHWIWEDDYYLKAWITILMQVNHEDRKVLIKGSVFDCKRGQSLMSLGEWVKLFNYRRKRRKTPYWTMKKVRTFFDTLQLNGMIVYKGVSKTTRLTVCNYDKYQGGGQLEGNLRASRGQQTRINKNDKNSGESQKVIIRGIRPDDK